MGKEFLTKSVNPINNCLSLFDEQFTISDFSESIEVAEASSESVLSIVRAVVQKAYSKNQADSNYVVDMSNELKESIDNGGIELVTSKSGEIYAQLRSANGRFGKPIPIKKELSEEGISVEAVQMALKMDVIKVQLKIIIEGIKEIEGRLTDVIQGQKNDRIGLFYSGLSLFAEARGINDEFLKKQIMAQALKSISDANSQMIQEIRTSVEYLVTEQYRHLKNKTEKIDEHLSIIQQCYDVVYRASFFKASIYQENGEIASMLMAIDQYGRFVEKMIVPYVGKLSELDRSNKFIEKGRWGKIAHSLVSCQELIQQISEGSTYLLPIRGEYNGK